VRHYDFRVGGRPVNMPTPAAVAAAAYIQSFLSSFELTVRALMREEEGCVISPVGAQD
jgi:hypothetical protein